MAAIKAAIGVVLANEPPRTSAAQHRLFTNIDHAADELSRLIDDLVEVERLRTGRVELYRSVVDLRDVLSRAVAELEPLLESRGRTLDVRLPPDPVMREVDVVRFRRAVGGVVRSADGERVLVEVRQDCIVVSHDGPPNERASLELAIARGLVELHGGQLTVEGEPGRSTTFRISV